MHTQGLRFRLFSFLFFPFSPAGGRGLAAIGSFVLEEQLVS